MSSEVGSAHISIFPVMTGFRSKVNKEVKSTGDEASNSFKSAFRNAGGVSGRQLGKQLKESFAASSKVTCLSSSMTEMPRSAKFA